VKGVGRTMSEKKIDVGQINSIDISTSLSNIMYGKYGEMNFGLLESIKGGDASKAALKETTSAVTKCSENLTTAITQINRYVNEMAKAFQEMDQEISEKFNTSVTEIKSASHNQSTKSSNKYSGAF
jgi:methyl-accepting chemotaxis protein